MQHHFFRTIKFHLPEAVTQDRIQHFLDEEPSVGSTPATNAFHLGCLLPDLSPNPAWQRPEQVDGPLRVELSPWLLQREEYPVLMKDVDKDLSDEAWKNYVPVITVHGDRDTDAPYELSVLLCDVVGK